ncbi:MAG: ribonuclease E/G, partial [Ornithinimicrobium sp.]
SGNQAWEEVSDYIERVAPDLRDRVEKWTSTQDIFTEHRITEAVSKAMDRKVWLPSGGSLVIDRTEAMTVVDVNTGKFVGSGGNLEETVTKNNIEAAEEIVRQLRVRDIGGIIVIDFIDMVLESNRDLVVRRLLECLGRDRTKHQVAEVTSLGLVQMTRKRVGSGLIEVFSEPCVHCNGRGLVVHSEPVEKPSQEQSAPSSRGRGARKGRGSGSENSSTHSGGGNGNGAQHAAPKTPSGPTPAQIAAAAHAAALNAGSSDESANATAVAVVEVHAEASDGFSDAAAVDVSAAEPSIPETEMTETEMTETDVIEVAAPARPRRKRGRVVAPAGPPAAGSGEEA